MFGIDGPEFVVILIVLIVVVGPKDLPKMLKAFGKATARMRATANEFRRQFDDAMHEAELDDLQKTLTDVSDLDPRKKLTEIFDPIRDVAKDVKASIENKKTPDGTETVTTVDETTISVVTPITPEAAKLFEQDAKAASSESTTRVVSDEHEDVVVKTTTEETPAVKKRSRKTVVSKKATNQKSDVKRSAVSAQDDKSQISVKKAAAAEKTTGVAKKTAAKVRTKKIVDQTAQSDRKK